MSDKYAAIAADRERYPVRLMCAALGVSESGFYAVQERAPCARTARNEALRLAVRTVFTTTRGRYGSPRIHDELSEDGLVRAATAPLRPHDRFRSRRSHRAERVSS